MFCNNCGAELPEGGKFCTKCGTKIEAQPVENIQQPVQDDTVTNAQQPAYEMPKGQPTYEMPNAQPAYGMPQGQPAPKEKKPVNKKLIIIIAAVAVALIIIVGAVVAVGMFIKIRKETAAKTINFKEEYIEIIYSGYDSYGNMGVEINKDKFYPVALKALGYDEDTKSEKASEKLMDLVFAIDIGASEYTGLSNGQEITITVTVDEKELEKLDVILKDTEFTVKVSGLKDVIEIDPFEKLDVSTSGFDGSVYVEWDYTGEYLDKYDFSCDNTWDLSIGDSFTIYIGEYTADYFLEYEGVKFTQTKKTYSVEAADRYIQKYEEISDDFMSEIKKTAEEALEAEYDRSYLDFSLKSYEYYGAYFMTGNNSDAYDNILCMVYKCNIISKDDDFDPVDVYVPIYCYELVERADKTQDMHTSVYVDTKMSYVDDSVWNGVYGYLTEEDMFHSVCDYEMYYYEFIGKVKDFSSDKEEEATEPSEDPVPDEETSEEPTTDEESTTEE